MNQEKLGKFIASLRKEKKLTQEKFAEILNVDRTTISKWERGISAPDISLLQPICNVFDITVSELLNYEKGSEITSDKDNTIAAIKYYNKQSQKKYFQIFIIVLLFIVGILITGLTVINYNKYEIYEIRSNDKDFNITGYYFASKTRDILFIKNIDYNDIYVGTTKEIKVQQLKVRLLSNNKEFYSVEVQELSDGEYIDELLNNISFYYDSNKSEDGETKRLDLKNLILNIETNNLDEKNNQNFSINLIIE